MSINEEKEEDYLDDDDIRIALYDFNEEERRNIVQTVNPICFKRKVKIGELSKLTPNERLLRSKIMKRVRKPNEKKYKEAIEIENEFRDEDVLYISDDYF